MLYVLCTFVIIGGHGERIVHTMQGVEIAERGDDLTVDFGKDAPFTPQVQHINNNDCLYLQDPEKAYQDMLNRKELEDRIAKEDSEAWQKVIDEEVKKIKAKKAAKRAAKSKK